MHAPADDVPSRPSQPPVEVPRLDVEIWSDVVCPWCYIGKRRFERALDELAGEIDVDVVYRPYQLDPTAPAGATQPVAEAYARKFGGPERAAQIIGHVTSVAAGEGLDFHLDVALRANTLAAHRLLWWAEHVDGGGPDVQRALKERLLQAYFVDGDDVGSTELLASCAGEVGLDAAAAAAFLAGDDGTAEVRALLAHASEQDITAVPTYVISDPDRTAAWVVPGAQDTEVFVKVLRRLVERLSAAQADTDG